MTRQRFSVLAALFVVAMVLGGLNLHPRTIQAQKIPPGRLSSCVGVITSTAKISVVDPCTYEVKVNFEPQCPICKGGINVVFVQVSELFIPAWQNDTAATALQALERVARDNKGVKIKGAVIHYDRTNVRVITQMTENLSSIRGALRQPRLGHDPVGDVEGAAQAAVRQLDLAHRDDPDKVADDDKCDLVIFYASTKSVYTDMRRKMLNAANTIKKKKVPLIVGCPEAPPDYCIFVKEMSNEYSEYPQPGKIRSMSEGHFEEYTEDDGIALRFLEMAQLVPPGLTYVDGSASIPPTTIKPEGELTRLGWSWDRPAELQPLSVTYRVRPIPGVGAVYNVDGMMKIVDAQNKLKDMPMASQAITVPEGICLPTPTPTDVPPTETPGPVPTDTPVPTATDLPVPTDTPVPTATNTAVPTRTPTPNPKPIYIPIIVGETCFQQWVHGDVVLVLDVSTSMDRLSRKGRSKLAASLDAAKAFVGMMDFTPDTKGKHDQVSVVGFNDRAWIQTGLTADPAAALAAIDALPQGKAEGTRLDLAFRMGLEAGKGAARRGDNSLVMIFLTDGLPNRVPPAEDGTVETTVRRAAQAAKDEGMRVYTIGIGAQNDINPQLLGECATDPSGFHYAPDPEDLGGIYTQIAHTIGCPPDDFWGGR